MIIYHNYVLGAYGNSSSEKFHFNWTGLKKVERHTRLCNGMLISSILLYPSHSYHAIRAFCPRPLCYLRPKYIQMCKGSPCYSVFESLAQTVGRWLVMAATVEEGLVGALIPAQSISNPALSVCHSCSCSAHRVHNAKCSTPTCFGWKMKSQFNWPSRKIMVCALWYDG